MPKGIPGSRGTCNEDGCDGPHAGYGMCQKHYTKWKRLHDPNCPTCTVDGCDKNALTRGWCPAHYQRWRKTGDTMQHQPLREVGRGYIAKNGYRMVAGEAEHRTVMEGMLGRPLRDFENVHHINGIRHDNRPENLELWVKSQPPGQRASDLAKWVVDTYPELVEAALADHRQLRIV